MKISRVPLGLVFATLFAFVASDVMAQRGGPDGGRDGGRRGGQRGGPGGFGGRGGGFGGGGFGRGGGGMLGLLRNEQIRDEIELMPDQEEAVQKIRDNQENQPRPERPDFDFRDQSEENRAKIDKWMEKVQKQRAEAEQKVRDQLEEVLFPPQFERLNEIYIQSMGLAALMTDPVIKELKITKDQQAKMREVGETARDEIRSKMREMFSGGGRPDEGARESMRETMTNFQKKMEEKILAVLETSQKKEFEEMKGETFEGLGQFGFGGRGGPGGGGFGGRGGRGGPGGGGFGGRGGPGGDRGRGGRGGDGGGRPEAE